MTKLSLEQIRAMHASGELEITDVTPEEETLPLGFGENAPIHTHFGEWKLFKANAPLECHHKDGIQLLTATGISETVNAYAAKDAFLTGDVIAYRVVIPFDDRAEESFAQKFHKCVEELQLLKVKNEDLRGLLSKAVNGPWSESDVEYAYAVLSGQKG